MRKSGLVSSLTLLYALSLVIHSAFACTIFTANKGETVLFGGNEDQGPNDAYLIVDTSRSYGVVYIGTSWGRLSMVEMTGINDRGLSFDCNWIPSEALNPHPERGTPGEWMVTHILKLCATVEEVLEIAFTFDWGESMDYQVHFTDAIGDAAVIHPGTDGELTHTKKLDGDGYLVSTNFNLASIETGDYSCWRYDTASEMLSELETGDALTVEFMASVLDATHQEGEVSTIYSTVYDLKGRTVYLYYDHRFEEPVILDVAAELERGGSTGSHQ
ncbi:MAG: hypothetical protein JSV18_07195 [Candidatus Bathyarchaeota archaeon]|nr:MAG: hypothetical protein JSV18_07195 [Candidatus Bathyarchaeota archaeon]